MIEKYSCNMKISTVYRTSYLSLVLRLQRFGLQDVAHPTRTVDTTMRAVCPTTVGRGTLHQNVGDLETVSLQALALHRVAAQ